LASGSFDLTGAKKAKSERHHRWACGAADQATIDPTSSPVQLGLTPFNTVALAL